MGEVYEAEDSKLGRHVALKVLPEETARDPQMRQRFEREAKAIAALNHPNIVTIYSVEEADGVDFMTMELIEGQTLREALPRGGLPLERLLALTIPLAEAVAAAHQQGITHRDLKPENVILGRDGKIKVLDFGLAKVGAFFGEASGGSRLPTRALTEEGRIVGTVAYMSPEQAEGKPVDPRSDVFTLGIILYEISTGQQPFRGDTAMSILSSILKENPPPVTQINATLPRDLSRIVNRCLTKDPARRFQSAVGLATELAEVKQLVDSGELGAAGASAPRSGVITTPSAAPASMPRPSRGGALKYAAAAAIAAVAVGGFVAMRQWRGRTAVAGRAAEGHPTPATGTSAGARPADARQRIVVLPFENLGATDDAYFADGMTEEISSRLASVNGLGVISRTSAMQYAKTTKTTKQIGEELGVDYVLAGTVRWDRGAGRTSRVRVTPQLVRVADDTQLWGDRYDREMKDIFSVQSEIAGQVVDKLGLAMRKPGGAEAGVPPTQNLEAYQLYLRGKAEVSGLVSSRDVTMHGVAALEQAVRLDPRFAQGWAMLSYAHSSLYHFRYDYTEERLSKARECADKALSLQRDLREGHRALGYYYYWGRGDYAQALQELQSAAGSGGDDAESVEAMAFVMRRQGRFDEALAAMERAYALNPREVELIDAMRETYEILRRYQEAVHYSDLALSLEPKAAGPLVGRVFLQLEIDGNTRVARQFLARVDRADFPELPGIEGFFDAMDGRFKDSIEKYQAIPMEVIENQSFYRPKALSIGLGYLVMDDRARAQAPCEAARQLLDKAIAGSPRDPRMRAALGMALACLGRKEEAIREARLAADLVPVSTDALDGPLFQEWLARVDANVGELDAACDIIDKLLATPSGSHAKVLKLDPEWSPLWKFPRFQKLMEKYG
jgi:TolB-like protein/tetratricopeptide (TPR) repeat protein/predicted Ser/Thr protein kinase